MVVPPTLGDGIATRSRRAKLATRAKKSSKPGTTKKLAKSLIALAVTALAEKAFQKVRDDPRVRRKAKALGKAARKRVKMAGKKVGRLKRLISR